ncbi:unnamed protein product [Rotaria sp. Silwood2]|nr:unnamed protein product [Rotaria sp. Silwood2]CAF2705953.1 unnamed protein product [Rotaria sp. Silwood2]CAF3100559.1 unnamed protein product [Rotaria sp. Silwood2]CAF4104225.1 unnamed protein product [Rotaria sp. Silwood2]CAF4153148.1 unnamed protein product [Rotaria sp. Silwood2]
MGAIHAIESKLADARSAHDTNNLETLSLIWLDDSIKNSKESLIIEQKLRTVIHHVTIFHDTLDEPLSASILALNSNQNQSTTELNGQFIHSEVSMDVLLRMKSKPTDKNELIKLYKETYKDNMKELTMIDEFEQNYSPDRALWWYTRDSFLYRLLNKALRVQNIDMIFLFRFFIRDIEQQLKQHKCTAPIRVYRGQVMSNEELKVLRNSIGHFISMKSFLSTSIEQKQALKFLNATTITDDLQRVLIVIDADPRIDGVKPFANITVHSYFPGEKEVLMMLGDKQHTWKPVFEHMKNQHGRDDGQTDLLSFGSVLSNMGKYDDAERYFHRLLNELPHDDDGIAHCYHNLGEIALEKGDYEVSLEWFYKSLEIKMQTLELHHPDLAESHNSIGIVYRKKGD